MDNIVSDRLIPDSLQVRFTTMFSVVFKAQSATFLPHLYTLLVPNPRVRREINESDHRQRLQISYCSQHYY